MMLYRFYNQDSTWLDGADFTPRRAACAVFFSQMSALL